MEILAIRAVGAAASQPSSKPKTFNLDIQSDVINLHRSYCSEFRACQTALKFLDAYDERIFDAVLSFSQDIHIWLPRARKNDFKCNNTTFYGPEWLQN